METTFACPKYRAKLKRRHVYEASRPRGCNQNYLFRSEASKTSVVDKPPPKLISAKKLQFFTKKLTSAKGLVVDIRDRQAEINFGCYIIFGRRP